MTERERWIVYPLLFLALGAALRDKLFERTTTRSIVCQELTVVEEQPIGHQPVRVLAKIGQTEPTAGSPSIGYLVVNGQMSVDGAVNVNGVINARQYAVQGFPFTPGVQAVLPGMSLPDFLRAIQQAAQNQSGSSQPASTTPHDSTPDQSPPTNPPVPPENAPVKDLPAGDAPNESGRLADPAQKR